MKQSQRRAVQYILSTTLLACNWSAFGSFNDGAPSQYRRGCGDYTILSDARDRAIFDRHCGTNEERDFKILLDSVNLLDPKREAHAAASRGDFRLAAFTAGGAEPPGARPWSTVGVNCMKLEDADVVIFLRYSDVLPGLSFMTLQNKMLDFTVKYNRALISEDGFPIQRECKSASLTN